MKLQTSDHVLELMEGYMHSAALNAALECGLFWDLDQQPRSLAKLSSDLGISQSRVHHWVQLLCDYGLLEIEDQKIRTAPSTNDIILGKYSRATWQSLAQMSRERMPSALDMPKHLRDPRSVWAAQGLSAPNYFDAISNDPGAAHQYTYMLYEMHRPLAEALADHLAVKPQSRILDIGGGSGVVSMALAERDDSIQAIVADIPTVCASGRLIAAERGLSFQVEYRELDFHRDPLPGGIDVAITCDTGPYSTELFSRIRDALRPGGILAIVEQFPADDLPSQRARHWLSWSLRGALQDKDYTLPGFGDFSQQLHDAGFFIRSRDRLKATDAVRWAQGWTAIVASPLPGIDKEGKS